MTPFQIRFTKEALKDLKKLPPKLRRKLEEMLVNGVAPQPYSGKKLVGDLAGLYSVRLSFKDRVVYSIDDKNRIVYIHRARTHYGD
jgi:Txe/YoeB family toxin of toxin-antitoxin system